MKQLVILVLLTGVLCQNFSGAVVYYGFSMNRDFISKNLCIKKDVKDNCCQGSCHLKKELARENEQKENHPLQSVKEAAVQIFCNSVTELFKPTAPMVYAVAPPAAEGFRFHAASVLCCVFQPPELNG